MYKVKVVVTLKESVIDPQGSATLKKLHSLRFEEVKSVRVGKYVELELDVSSEEEARERAEAMCQALLVNRVVEDYALDIVKEG